MVFTVQGCSMVPTLYAGDKVFVNVQKTYRKEDIIVYPYKEAGLFIHRIIAEAADSYICRGDNNKQFERVKMSDVVGKVILIQRSQKDYVEIS